MQRALLMKCSRVSDDEAFPSLESCLIVGPIGMLLANALASCPFHVHYRDLSTFQVLEDLFTSHCRMGVGANRSFEGHSVPENSRC